MSIEALLQGGQGFLFLHPTQSEIQRALAGAGVRLPTPQPIFLEGEKPTGLSGYLMVETPELQLFETVLSQDLQDGRDFVLEHRDVPGDRGLLVRARERRPGIQSHAGVDRRTMLA